MAAIAAVVLLSVFVAPFVPGQTRFDADARGSGAAALLGGALDEGTVTTHQLGGTEQWLELLQQAEAESGVPWQVMAAIMNIESGGVPTALSLSGAVGLMQVMPEHWQGLADTFGGDLWDPWTNVRTAADILAQNRAAWGSWDRVAAAYFGAIDAEGNITAATDAYGTTGYQYVERFLANLARVGFGPMMAQDYLAQLDETLPLERRTALAHALDTQGAAYTWGGESYDEGGFDCSGLIYWSYGKAGIWLPRTAAEQHAATLPIDEADLQPGDLIFFSGTTEEPIEGVTHVAIYAGAGLMLNAPNFNDVVRLVPLDSPFWREHLTGFGRVV